MKQRLKPWKYIHTCILKTRPRQSWKAVFVLFLFFWYFFKVPAYAETVHNGLPQKTLEEDLCWIVPHVPPTIESIEGLSEWENSHSFPRRCWTLFGSQTQKNSISDFVSYSKSRGEKRSVLRPAGNQRNREWHRTIWDTVQGTVFSLVLSRSV